MFFPTFKSTFKKIFTLAGDLVCCVGKSDVCVFVRVFTISQKGQPGHFCTCGYFAIYLAMEAWSNDAENETTAVHCLVLLICLLIAFFHLLFFLAKEVFLQMPASLSPLPLLLLDLLHTFTYVHACIQTYVVHINWPMHCTQQTWIWITVCNCLLTGFRMEWKKTEKSIAALKIFLMD